MSKVNLDTLIGLLEEYENNDLDDVGKHQLKDCLLDLSDRLYDEDIREGWNYDGMMILVEQGGELPQPHKEMVIKSNFSDESYKVKIKEITELRQNKDGNLVVEVLAKKLRA